MFKKIIKKITESILYPEVSLSAERKIFLAELEKELPETIRHYKETDIAAGDRKYLIGLIKEYREACNEERLEYNASASSKKTLPYKNITLEKQIGGQK